VQIVGYINTNKDYLHGQKLNVYLLLNYSTYFGRPSHPSSGVHKTVVAASGTDHTIWGASFFKLAVPCRARLKKLARQIV